MNFFYGDEPEMFTFFKIPKLLFSEPYRNVSTEAKVLFGLMLDRMALSAKSQNWTDPDGRVYIYFPVEETMEILNVGNQKAVKLYKELEACELIQRERQPVGKPAKIYVRKFFDGCKNHTSRSVKITPPSCENHTARSVKITPLPYKETDVKETDIIETYSAEPPLASPAPTVPPVVPPEKPKRKRNPPQSPELTPDEESALLTFSPGLRDEVRDWFRYKAERGQMYGETFRKKFIGVVTDNARKYGHDAVAALIRNCAANGYQGVIWDNLTRNGGGPGGYASGRYGGGYQPSPDYDADRAAKERWGDLSSMLGKGDL